MSYLIGQNLLAIILCFIGICYAATIIRNKREAFQLPDGVEAYIPSIKPNFKCESSGYFADIENNCQLFHVCAPQDSTKGKSEIMHYTFACGNKTIFNQFSMTCTLAEESIPCASSKDFFYLNEKIGKDKELIHSDADIEKLASYLSKDE